MISLLIIMVDLFYCAFTGNNLLFKPKILCGVAYVEILAFELPLILIILHKIKVF